MKINLQDLNKFHTLKPSNRALMAMQLGLELKKKGRKPFKLGQMPPALEKGADLARPMLARLHGLEAAPPKDLEDFKLLPPKPLPIVARDTIEARAVRILAVSMLDPEPIPRIASAYAYWQATGAKHAVLPVLQQSLQSVDEDEKLFAYHALANISPQRAARLATQADSEPGDKALPRTDSMTVIIHGTGIFAPDGEWWQPDGNFHAYIQKNVYPDVYSNKKDFFRWSGRYSDTARQRAARALVAWCQKRPTNLLRFIAHSHGANVVNLATQLGMQPCTLIHLSPPVHNQYLPDLGNVTSGTFFNIHSQFDLVVFLDGGAQNYNGTLVANAEQERVLAGFGHSASHDPGQWALYGIPAFVRSVCP